MITSGDLQALRDSFLESSDRAVPGTLCGDVALVLGVSGVSISLFGTTDEVTLCASSPDGFLLDEWAFTFREQGALHAAISTYSVSDTAKAAASWWPRLSAKANEMGYRSLATIPLQIEGRVFGMIRLHDREGSIGTETMADAERMANELVRLLVGTYRRRSSSIDDRIDRDEFHQATGMVMSQMGIAASAAAELLREYARARDLTLADVAREVVGRTLDMRSAPATDQP